MIRRVESIRCDKNHARKAVENSLPEAIFSDSKENLFRAQKYPQKHPGKKARKLYGYALTHGQNLRFVGGNREKTCSTAYVEAIFSSAIT